MYMKQLNTQVTCTYNGPVAQTKQGKLRGLKIDSTYIFRGIKYANAKRFHPPVEVEPWEGVKEAFQFGHVCCELNTPVPHDQFTVPHFFYPQNENCQYLNIWTQSLDKTAKRPVMVWLHGGGWFSGSSVELLSYDGENLSAFGDVGGGVCQPPAQCAGLFGHVPVWGGVQAVLPGGIDGPGGRLEVGP